MLNINYINLLKEINSVKNYSTNRTGIQTKSIISTDLFKIPFTYTNQFPLIQVRIIPVESAIVEFLWIIKGKQDIKYLQENGCTYWNPWAINGQIKNSYGKQFRNFNGIDQLKILINNIKQNPSSRRHIISLWNPVEIENSTLPPCHCFFQFIIRNNSILLHIYMRSVDVLVGLPCDIIFATLLLYLVCNLTNYYMQGLIFHFGDAHIYTSKNNLEIIKKILTISKEELEMQTLPYLQFPLIKKIEEINQLKKEDITFSNYSYILVDKAKPVV